MGKKKEIIEDDLVPSLTFEEIEYIKENLLVNNSYYGIGESILKKLNGVETDKERPN